MLMDVHQRGNLRFPQSLPEFQRLFPDDAACAGYLEKARWSDGFVCPHCQAAGEPFRFANRPGVLRCRKCRRDTGLTVGTVMARSHTPLSVWFWSAYLVSSQTPGMSAVQLRRQLGLSRGSTLHVVGVGNNRIGKPRSMPRIKLTKSAIDTLPTPESDTVYWDTASPGFGVKVTPKGRKVFIVLYRTGECRLKAAEIYHWTIWSRNAPSSTSGRSASICRQA